MYRMEDGGESQHFFLQSSNVEKNSECIVRYKKKMLKRREEMFSEISCPKLYLPIGERNGYFKI